MDEEEKWLAEILNDMNLKLPEPTFNLIVKDMAIEYRSAYNKGYGKGYDAGLKFGIEMSVGVLK